jgi:hypothetical protein
VEIGETRDCDSPSKENKGRSSISRRALTLCMSHHTQCDPNTILSHLQPAMVFCGRAKLCRGRVCPAFQDQYFPLFLRRHGAIGLAYISFPAHQSGFWERGGCAGRLARSAGKGMRDSALFWVSCFNDVANDRSMKGGGGRLSVWGESAVSG